MAHLLETGINGVKALFGRAVPGWHGLGKVKPAGQLWSREEIRAEGLIEPVEKVQNQLSGRWDGVINKDSFAIVRVNDGKILGPHVGAQYHPFQDEEMFDLAETLTARAGMENVGIDACLKLKGGTIFTLLMRPETPFTVLGEQYREFISLANWHDGSGSRKVNFTNERVVCANTLAMALAQAKGEIFCSRHTANSLALTEANLEKASEILGILKDNRTTFQKYAESMATKKFSMANWKALLEEVLPAPSKDLEAKAYKRQSEDHAEKLSILYKLASAQDLQNFNGTAYKPLQVFAAFASHVTKGVDSTSADVARSRQENRVLAQITGKGENQDLLAKANSFLLAYN